MSKSLVLAFILHFTTPLWAINPPPPITNDPNSGGGRIESPSSDVPVTPAKPPHFFDAPSSVCPGASFFAVNFPDGSPLCAPAATLPEMEDHRFSCAVNVYNHTVALDFLYQKKYKIGYPIYDYWSYYAQPPLFTCDKGTIFNAGEYCTMFDSFEEAAIDHYHCNKHLAELKDLLAKEQVPTVPACQDGGDFKDGNHVGATYKQVGDPKASCKNKAVIILPKQYASVTPSQIEILDVNYQPLDKANRKKDLVGGRPAFCSIQNSSNFGSQGLVIRYKVNGVDECRTVDNANKRED